MAGAAAAVKSSFVTPKPDPIAAPKLINPPPRPPDLDANALTDSVDGLAEGCTDAMPAFESFPASPWRPTVERPAAVDALEFEAKPTPTLERALPSTRGAATSCAGCVDFLEKPKEGAMT